MSKKFVGLDMNFDLHWRIKLGQNIVGENEVVIDGEEGRVIVTEGLNNPFSNCIELFEY